MKAKVEQDNRKSVIIVYRRESGLRVCPTSIAKMPTGASRIKVGGRGVQFLDRRCITINAIVCCELEARDTFLRSEWLNIYE